MKDIKKKLIAFGIVLVCIVLLVLADQYTKLWATKTLMNQKDIQVIPGVLSFHYLENRGMAFGMLQGAQIFFFIVTVIVVCVLTIGYFKLPLKKRYIPLQVIYALIVSGAIGNFIDRTFNGFVVDFLQLDFIDFPVFNVADCYVTVSCVALFIVVLFVYKEDEMKKFFTWKKKG